MPLRISTAPELVKLRPLENVVVPVLADLRNVPALRNRPFAMPLPRLAAFWAWNNAPARLVMTAPLMTPKIPAPLQSTVPPFSSVRALSETELGMAALSVTPTGMMVLPLPLIVPAFQFITLLMITLLVPVIVPLAKCTMAGETTPLPLKLAVPPAMVTVLFVQM